MLDQLAETGGRNINLYDKKCIQKIKGGSESICPKCIYINVCFAKDNQPCIECNQYIEVPFMDIAPVVAKIRHGTFDAENGTVTYRVPITNGDKIRCMTDEELANEYIRIYKELPHYTDSWAWLRAWLKEEAT